MINAVVAKQITAIAATTTQSISFLIVGTGTLENELKAAASDSGNVIFAGYYGDISKIADVIDVFVLTSDSEACPLSLIEAMTLSKPCVSCAGGGAAEVISDGVTGFVTPHGDPSALADKLAYLSAHPDLGMSLGNAGRQVADAKFSLETMGKKIESIYCSLVKGGKNG